MRIAIIGPLCRDTIIIDSKTTEQLGGVTYYAGMALASLGAEVSVLAMFDNEPIDFVAPLEKLEVTHLPAPGTIHFTNIYDSNRPDARTQRAKIPANIITPEVLAGTDLASFDAIILGPLFHDNLPRETLEYIAKAQRPTYLAAQGMFRYLDGDRIVWRNPQNLLNILPFITTVLMDEEELGFVTGATTVTEGVPVLRKHGAREIIVTAGSRGSRIFAENTTYDIPAFAPSKLVDPTGAGDSYLAGYVYARTLNHSPKEAGRFAAAVATTAIEKSGPFFGNIMDIENLLRKT